MRKFSTVIKAIESISVVSFGDVGLAAYRIKNKVKTTSTTYSQGFSDRFGCNVYFKREFEHRTGSFKERGARNFLEQLSVENRKKGVITASAGNHALAVAYHGQLLSVPATVVMPTVAPLTKVLNCQKFGAKVIQYGNHLLEAKEYAMKLCEEEDMTYINGYDDPSIIAGQGTIGLEILEQVPNVDAIVVPIGGGGLVAGIAMAVKSLRKDITIIGVEPERCASWTAAVKAGKPVTIDMGVNTTLADGLQVTHVGPNSFAVAHHLIDKLQLVPESAIALAVLRLLEVDRCVVEGGGATGLASFMYSKDLRMQMKGKNVVFVLCGGNIDTPVLGRVIERGLAADGRLHRISLTISDRPGGVAKLCQLIFEAGASVKDILHERAWLQNDVDKVVVKVIVETRNFQHARELNAKFLEAGYIFTWGQGEDSIGRDELEAGL